MTLFQKYSQATEHRRGRKAIFSHSNWMQKIWWLIYTDSYRHPALENYTKLYFTLAGNSKINNKLYFFNLSYILTGTEKVSISVAQKSLAMLCSYCRCSPSVPTSTPSALLKAFTSSFESHQRCYKLISRAETGELLLVHLYIQTKLLFYRVTLVPLASVKQQLQKNTV